MSTLKRLFDAITNPAINKTWIVTLEPDGGAPWREFTKALGEAERQLEAQLLPDAMLEACDRTEIIINRALNCNWLTVNDREQFKATLRIALDTEVAAGGPYLDNGWNRSAPVPSSDGTFCHNEGATFCSTCGLAKLGRVVPDKSPPPDDVRSALAEILKHAQAPKRAASERLDNIEALAKKGLDALRSAPVSAPARHVFNPNDVGFTLKDCGCREGICEGLTDGTCHKPKVPAPAVGVTREAIVQIAEHIVDTSRECRLGKTQESVNYNFDNSRAQCIKFVTDTILALSPAPDAAVSDDNELTLAQIFIINDMIKAWLDEPQRYRDAFRNDCKRLLAASPQDVGREATVSARDAVIEAYAKGAGDADNLVGALWSDLFNKDMVKSEGADYFDKWRVQIRSLASRAKS